MLKQLPTALSLIFLLFVPHLQAQSSKELPNIIYIMVDDMGYGDLSCYGQTTLKTPHIDQIAKEGMRLSLIHISEPTRPY